MTWKGFILAFLFFSIFIAKGCKASKSTPPASVGSGNPVTSSNDGGGGSAVLTIEAIQSLLTPSSAYPLTSLAVQIDPGSFYLLYDSNRHATNPALDDWTQVELPDPFILDLQNLENSQIASVVIPEGDIVGVSFTFKSNYTFEREGAGCNQINHNSERLTVFLLSKDKGSHTQSVADLYTINSNGPSKFWDLSAAVYQKTHEIAGFSRIVTGELPLTSAGPDLPIKISVGFIDTPDYATACNSPPPILDFNAMATSESEFITQSREERNAYLSTTDTGINSFTVYESFCQYGYIYTLQASPFDKTLVWVAKKYNGNNCTDPTPNWTMTINSNYSLDYDNLFLSQFVGFPTTITSMTLVAQTSATVTGFNSTNVCGFTNWSLNSTKNVSDCSTNLLIQNGGSIGMTMANIHQTISGIFIPIDAGKIDVLFDHENNPGQYTRITLYSDITVVQPPSCPTLGFALTCVELGSDNPPALLLNDYLKSL